MSSDAAVEQQNDTKLDLQTKMSETGACERHFVVTVPRSDIDKQFKTAFDEIAPQAEMPGFRVGKAPRKLLESRFRTQVKEQVKSTLVMQALQQITEAGDISAISEPDMDYGAVQLPDTGDFTFEFTIEVRPQFDTPNWKGLELTRPTFNLSEDVIDQQMVRTLSRFSDGEAIDTGAELGDKLVINATFTTGGTLISTMEEESVTLREKLSFADCEIPNFGELMQGVKEGESRSTSIKVPGIEENTERSIEATFEVDSIFRLDPSAIPPSILETFGFDSVEEVRTFVRGELEKQQEFQQQQHIRTQVTSELLKDSKWDMPNTLIDRQTNRELQRRVLEMRRNGSSEDDIKIAVNAMRRNARENTIAALREHFLLEKIAEEMQIEPTSEEYETEIEAIADQAESTVRKMRAMLERSGQMDAIRNQIIERRVIEEIIKEAKVTEVEDASFLKALPNESAINQFVIPVNADLPVAKYDDRPTDGEKDSSTVKLER